MDNVEIGKLMLIDTKKWNKFKRKHANVYKELDYAVVKDLEDEEKVLIEETRLSKIIDNTTGVRV